MEDVKKASILFDKNLGCSVIVFNNFLGRSVIVKRTEKEFFRQDVGGLQKGDVLFCKDSKENMKYLIF